MENINEFMQSVSRKTIFADFDFENDELPCGCSKFGGVPDVPDDFIWPVYCGEGYDGETKERPLAFMFQINCEDIAQYDTENIYPHSGVLSFFYEMYSQCWGFDPNHKGSSRVYYFEDSSALSPAAVPDDIEEENRLKSGKAVISLKEDYPHPNELDFDDDDDYDEYSDAYDEYTDELPSPVNKLGGYPMYIQSAGCEIECELVSRGVYTGSGNLDITDEVREAAKEWTMLFQLDSIDAADLMFGDCGRLFWFIRKDELANKNFDNAWVILQCY